MERFSYAETEKIARRLEDYHGVFSQLWQLGSPLYDDSAKTAYVSFDNVGNAIVLGVNKKFWKSKTDTQKDFIICHECLHVMLEHGARAKDAYKDNREACNVAMDVVVNELLVSKFGFDRKEVDPKNELCWRDTIYKDKTVQVDVDETFEYYFNRLSTMKPNQMGGPGDSMDDHSKLTDEDLSGLAGKVAKRLSEEEKESLAKSLGEEGKASKETNGGRSDEGGSFAQLITAEFVPPKRKWETVVTHWLQKHMDENVAESWLQTNRRTAAVGMSNVILPVERDDEDLAENKALVYMFLDTSGSCQHLASRFWKLAASVPKKNFVLKTFCFDTKVYEVNVKDRKLYGFGGTTFPPIERRIQQDKKENGRYPDAVFVITDGWGTPVHPEIPNRWHVLLTEDNKSKFPSECRFYNLEEFE